MVTPGWAFSYASKILVYAASSSTRHDHTVRVTLPSSPVLEELDEDGEQAVTTSAPESAAIVRTVRRARRDEPGRREANVMVVLLSGSAGCLGVGTCGWEGGGFSDRGWGWAGRPPGRRGMPGRGP